MSRYEVVIETRTRADGMICAAVVKGPADHLGRSAKGFTRAEALTALREDVSCRVPASRYLRLPPRGELRPCPVPARATSNAPWWR